MKNYLLSILAAVAVLCTACGGDDEPAEVNATGVKLDKAMVVLEIGESTTVKATLAPENATNKNVKWDVKNTAIATVNNGVVKGVAVGETELTVTTVDGGHTATIPVKVVAQSVKVTAIKLVGVPTEAKEGRITTISAVITPTDATDMTVTFTSSNPDVVKVEFTKSESNYSLATLTAVGPGKAKITATANDGSGVKAEAEVNVIPTIKVSEIKIGPENATIEVGETKQFAATISPSDADNKEVEWSSSDTSVATVAANGVVTGVGMGTATITATAKDGSGVKGSATITVVGEKPTSITVDGKNSVKLLTWHGKKLEIVPDMTPVNADLSTLTWNVSDWKTQNPCTCKIEAKKITVESNLSHYPYQFESVLNGTTIYGNGINDRFDFTAYFRTRAIFSNHFEDTKQRINLSLPTTPIQISADLEELPYTVNAGKLYFEAYCPPIEYSAGASPMWTQFPEAYIPTSEYTLTSSDETKWKVTKVNESTYKIEDLAPSNYKEIDLTYTCGEFSFTLKFKVVPK